MVSKTDEEMKIKEIVDLATMASTRILTMVLDFLQKMWREVSEEKMVSQQMCKIK